MPSKCIYDIFKWMGMALKYSGCISLPGLYEGNGRSAWKKLVIHVLLPTISFISFFWASFRVFYLGFKRYQGNLTDILVYLINSNVAATYVVFPIVIYFRMSKRLSAFLKLCEDIDDLLKPRKNLFKYVISFFFVGLVATSLTMHYSFLMARYYAYNGKYFAYQMTAFGTGFHTIIASGAQPHCMYISFQYILAYSFQQLFDKIKSADVSKLSQEDAAERLKEFSRINNTLCQLARMLDDIISPLLLFRFFAGYVESIFDIIFVTSVFSTFSLYTIFGMVTHFIVIAVVPNSAHRTQKAAMKILPAIYNTFKLNKKEAREKMLIFNLQELYFRCSFTASGFFQLDRKLIVAIFQSIMSQWVVFYKIQNGMQ